MERIVFQSKKCASVGMEGRICSMMHPSVRELQLAFDKVHHDPAAQLVMESDDKYRERYVEE